MGLTRLQLRTARAFLLVFLALVLPTAAAPRRESARVKTILVLGDSLSDGFRLSRSQAYPALLAQKLGAVGLDYDVINASVSGGTTSGGLQRLAAQLTRRIDIFILQLGINDAFRGTSIPQIRENLQTIIDRVKTKNPDVRLIVVGMQLPNYSTDDFVRDYGQMYVDLAAKNRAGLVPYLLEGVGGNPELNLPDLIHPNAAGHKVLANNVWRVLEPTAREVSVH
ncbi:MAG: arylesterase [Verrucomicrobiota bacterium]|nr:arylesterase [Verrucomicrobiota bacterium]